MNDESYISTELKIIEDEFNYLRGMDYSPAISAQLLSFSLELMKINLQARVIANQIPPSEMIERVVEAVIKRIEEKETNQQE